MMKKRKFSLGHFCARITLLFLMLSLVSPPQQVFAFDSTAVLPKGVSRVMVNTGYTQFDSKTNGDGKSVGFASAMSKDLSFADFASTLPQYEKLQLDAFMLSQGIDDSQTVGRMSAEFSGQMEVIAPSYAYGVNDRFTFGILVPFIKAQSDIAIGFSPNDNASSFLETLSRRELGLRSKVSDAVAALNTVPERLNTKLSANGYSELGAWSNSGIGDVMLKGKFLHAKDTHLAIASVAGVNVATGETDDPDNLTDIPLGDGSHDLFYGLLLDQPLNDYWFFNETFTYTAQLPSKSEVRMTREDVTITDEIATVNVDQGDYLNADLSLQYDGRSGFQAGGGYLFQHKYKDQYDAQASTATLEKDTAKQVQRAQAMLGYSSLRAYREKSTAVPYSGFLTYERHLASKNTADSDLLKFEVKVYF